MQASWSANTAHDATVAVDEAAADTTAGATAGATVGATAGVDVVAHQSLESIVSDNRHTHAAQRSLPHANSAFPGLSCRHHHRGDSCGRTRLGKRARAPVAGVASVLRSGRGAGLGKVQVPLGLENTQR